MKEIICYSKKFGNQIALVDDSDFEVINKYRWNVFKFEIKNVDEESKENNKIKYKFYARTSIKINDQRQFIFMHHMLVGKPEKNFVVDHINANSLDNTRTNLRKVTIQQNNQNKKPKNKYKGVCWHKKSQKYRCRALSKDIGSFDDEKLAAEAYDKYIIRNLDSSSLLNFTYSQEEIDIIKNEVTDTKKERELPDNISFGSDCKYTVRIQKGTYKVCESFKLLEDAIYYRDECLENLNKLEAEKLKLHYKKPITYNSDGNAYITVKYKDKNYECLVDENKWHDLSLFSWCLAEKYVIGRPNGKPERLNRYLYKKYLPEIDIRNKLIDHIDGKDELSKRLDNRMSNLRPVSFGENSYNKDTTSKLGYRGVQKINNKYYAYICHNNKRFTTERFSTLEEAVLAYNKLAIKYYGNMAKLNCIKSSN